jgi:peptidoglycan/xylan/chitin deacetylase (PgdA/CDA1 family)
MKKKIVLLVILFLGFTVDLKGQEPSDKGYQDLKQKVICELGKEHPTLWAEVVPSVKTRIDTDKNVIALTLDACGSEGDGYDSALINYLTTNNIPATLFINARWIDKNPDIFKQLAKNPLFEIENHGFEHKPCSVSGKSIYGIKGTRNAAEVVDEIEKNGRKITALTVEDLNTTDPGLPIMMK